MSSFFSSDGSTTIQFAIIFLVIFAVLAVAVFVFRRMAGRGQFLAAKAGGRGRQPRLGIVDIYELDRQRQLILLRRDNVEHLLLVGGPNDVVIERNISRGVGARLAEDEAPRPDVEPALDAPRIQPAFEPSFAMPAQVAPPLPGSLSGALSGSSSGATAHPDSVARSLDLVAPDLFAPDDDEPQAVRAQEPRPAVDESPEPTVSPAAAPASRPPRRMPPSLANLVPGAAKRARAADEAPVTVEAASPARPVDPAVLSDMARQLEQTVRRPLASVIPVRSPVAEAPSEPAATTTVAAPATAVASAPEPAPSELASAPMELTPIEPAAAEPRVPPSPLAASEAVDPLAAAMATTAETRDRDDALFEPSAPEPDRHTAAWDRSIPAVDRSTVSPDRTAPVVPEPAPVAPAPNVAKPQAEAPKPEPTPAKPATGPAATPFSVEEIEAEFARLLGRSLDKKN